MALDFPDSPTNGQHYNGFVYNSTTGAWKIGGLGTLDLTGGDETGVAGGYKYHIFTTVGTASLTASGSGVCEYLVLAGGGSGGGNTYGGGGGGAGGLLIGSFVLATGSYTVTVGQGGASVTSGLGNNGTDSSIDTLVVAAGGGAGGQGSDAGLPGGSGGGGGSANTNQGSGGSPTDAYTGVSGYAGPQGHRGGDGLSNGATGGTDGAGGGGGAGSPGSAGKSGGFSPSNASYWISYGGVGLLLNDWLVDVNAIATPTIGELQTDAWFIGGGGSGGISGTNSAGQGGYGGGGNGGSDNTAPTDATDLCGGGGGGSTDNLSSGAGGSGVVIVRYVV